MEAKGTTITVLGEDPYCPYTTCTGVSTGENSQHRLKLALYVFVFFVAGVVPSIRKSIMLLAESQQRWHTNDTMG